MSQRRAQRYGVRLPDGVERQGEFPGRRRPIRVEARQFEVIILGSQPLEVQRKGAAFFQHDGIRPAPWSVSLRVGQA